MKFLTSLAFTDPTHYCELARAAEENGWDGLVVSDHVVHPEKIRTPYPYTRDGEPRWNAPTPWPDPWVAIGAMAAVTRMVRFYTGIYVLPLRNPFAVAKAVGTAAVMSHGRVTLGIGVGWMKEEFDLLEQRFDRRGRRADEMLEVVRKLWAGGMVEHHGDFYAFERLQMSPAPSERIPVVVGGLSRAALRRAARLGDGWISDIHTAEELADIVARLRRLREEAGRSAEPFEVIAACSDAAGVEGYRRLEEIGVTHLQTMPWLFYGGPRPELVGEEALTHKRDGLRRFADDVIARMR